MGEIDRFQEEMEEEFVCDFQRGVENGPGRVANNIQRPGNARGRHIIKSKRRVKASPIETELDLGRKYAFPNTPRASLEAKNDVTKRY